MFCSCCTWFLILGHVDAALVVDEPPGKHRNTFRARGAQTPRESFSFSGKTPEDVLKNPEVQKIVAEEEVGQPHEKHVAAFLENLKNKLHNDFETKVGGTVNSTRLEESASQIDISQYVTSIHEGLVNGNIQQRFSSMRSIFDMNSYPEEVWSVVCPLVPQSPPSPFCTGQMSLVQQDIRKGASFIGAEMLGSAARYALTRHVGYVQRRQRTKVWWVLLIKVVVCFYALMGLWMWAESGRNMSDRPYRRDRFGRFSPQHY